MYIDLLQGSKQWLEWRATGLGGSDSASVLGENPWRSKMQLWKEKTGRAEGFKGNEASRRGQNMEPEARQAYNFLTDSDMIPACFQHDDYDFMLASLDGISSDGKKGIEIKCSGLTVHQKVLDSNRPPKYYDAQHQKNMACSGAMSWDYVSYNPDHETDIIIIPVERNEEYIAKLIEAETDFWNLIQYDIAPEVDEKEYVFIEDQSFESALVNYHRCKDMLKQAEKQEKLAKSIVLDFIDDGNCRGNNGKVTRIDKIGSINMDKLRNKLEISDEVFESFRKPGCFYWRITEK